MTILLMPRDSAASSRVRSASLTCLSVSVGLSKVAVKVEALGDGREASSGSLSFILVLSPDVVRVSEQERPRPRLFSRPDPDPSMNPRSLDPRDVDLLRDGVLSRAAFGEDELLASLSKEHGVCFVCLSVWLDCGGGGRVAGGWPVRVGTLGR